MYIIRIQITYYSSVNVNLLEWITYLLHANLYEFFSVVIVLIRKGMWLRNTKSISCQCVHLLVSLLSSFAFPVPFAIIFLLLLSLYMHKPASLTNAHFGTVHFLPKFGCSLLHLYLTISCV